MKIYLTHGLILHTFIDSLCCSSKKGKYGIPSTEISSFCILRRKQSGVQKSWDPIDLRQRHRTTLSRKTMLERSQSYI